MQNRYQISLQFCTLAMDVDLCKLVCFQDKIPKEIANRKLSLSRKGDITTVICILFNLYILGQYSDTTICKQESTAVEETCLILRYKTDNAN